MPPEPNLTAELSDVETLLKQYSPAASAINRDTLMYQAGFTAGEASTRKATHWLWPATTAAFAASLLMLLAFPSVNLIQQVSVQPEQPPKPIVEPSVSVDEPKVVRAARVPLKGYFSTAPMLVMRERALRGDFGDRRAEAVFDTWPQPSAFTNRQLLQEFLPVLPEPSLGGNS
jgi:hypothetical protein